ncbi:MAG: DUF1343 domain-containing protein [Armatimonadetes bacterium]|nr:DUF1343 domain-containing protein [Armatimonadota bacterium]
MQRVRPGVETLINKSLSLVIKSRIGLITNQSAVTSRQTHTADELLAAEVQITALFGPEHGILGTAPDGVDVPHSTDESSGIRVFSLYGETRRPAPEMISDLDAIVFDIQDVGSRFYTFLYTMALSMQACTEHGKRFIILDRPNPIGGEMVEGPILDTRFASFVGLYPIPVRYGMTVGELAAMFNREFGIGSDLRIVPLSGWRRSMWFDQTGLKWIPPSPAMRSLETAIVYPGMCLLEGTNVSEGRGTAAPFQTFGAPWIDAERLSDELNHAGLPGVRFLPVQFVPNSSKYAGLACSGERIEISDRERFLPVLTGVKVMETLHRLWPNAFKFSGPQAGGRNFFDLLAGTDHLRLAVEAGQSADEIASSWKKGVESFTSLREKYLLY